VIADPGREWSPHELVSIAVSHPPLFPPGTGWSYSNTNFVVLGLVIEAVTGAPLGQELRERLFGPLVLTATSFPAGTTIEGRFAHGYVGSGTLPALPDGTLIDATSVVSPSIGWAAGGIVSNADEVARFYAALLGGRLLHPDLLAEMRRVVPESQGRPFRYGLGIERFPTECGQAYGHLGDTAGYRTAVYAHPNGRRVAVVMVNIDTTRVSWPELQAAAETALCLG
jgi:D-alanyl-D-alanine carboxypeptidase